MPLINNDIIQIYIEFGHITPVFIEEGDIVFSSFTYDRVKLYETLCALYPHKCAYIASCIKIKNKKEVKLKNLNKYMKMCHELSSKYPASVINQLYTKLKQIFDLPNYEKLLNNEELFDKHIYNFESPSPKFDNYFTRKVSAWCHRVLTEKSFERWEKILGTRFKASDIKGIINAETRGNQNLVGGGRNMYSEPEVVTPLSWVIKPEMIKQLKQRLGGYVADTLDNLDDPAQARKEIYDQQIEQAEKAKKEIKEIENKYKEDKKEMQRQKQNVFRSQEYINLFNAPVEDFGRYFIEIFSRRSSESIKKADADYLKMTNTKIAPQANKKNLVKHITTHGKFDLKKDS